MKFSPSLSELPHSRPFNAFDSDRTVLFVRGEAGLLRENLRIYRCVGHQAGRYINKVMVCLTSVMAPAAALVLCGSKNSWVNLILPPALCAGGVSQRP